MAKKSSAIVKAGSSDSTEFNMAEEIRSLLKTNRNMSTRDIINAIREKFPKQTINENSCSVAVVYARRKMGITVVRKRRPVASPGKKAAWSAARPAAPVAKASAVGVPGIDLLIAAKELLKRCGGDETAALNAIRQVAALQM
jgi:hypothetical protein